MLIKRIVAAALLLTSLVAAVGPIQIQFMPMPSVSLSEAVAAAPKSTVVYITRTGKKYHRSKCRYLRTSKIKTTLGKARSRGFTPCKICKPPR